MTGKITRQFEKSLVEWRVKLGMTQAQLAEEIGISQRTVSKWEKGQARATKAMEFQVLEWAFEKQLIDSSPRVSWKEED